MVVQRADPLAGFSRIEIPNRTKNLPKTKINPQARNKQKGKPRMSKKMQVPRSLNNSLRLSKCALKFALASVDPFHPDAIGACIPSAPSPPSLKAHSLFRTTATIGTQGWGFVAINPSVVNDAKDMFFSGSLYAGDPDAGNQFLLSANTILAPGVKYQNSSPTLPYVASQLNSGAANDAQIISARLVACGVRVRYIGTALNQSGMTICYSAAQHDNAGNVSRSRAGYLPETSIEVNDKRPCTLNMFASDITDFEYGVDALPVLGITGAVYPWSKGDTGMTSNLDDPSAVTWTVGGNSGSTVFNGASPCGVIYFSGVAGQQVYVEVVKHIEYCGPGISTMATPTDSDPEGLAKVGSALALMNQKKASMTPKDREKGLWPLFVSSLKELWNRNSSVIVPVAVEALAALL